MVETGVSPLVDVLKLTTDIFVTHFILLSNHLIPSDPFLTVQ
jgi:hypothetical protein